LQLQRLPSCWPSCNKPPFICTQMRPSAGPADYWQLSQSRYARALAVFSATRCVISWRALTAALTAALDARVSPPWQSGATPPRSATQDTVVASTTWARSSPPSKPSRARLAQKASLIGRALPWRTLPAPGDLLHARPRCKPGCSPPDGLPQSSGAAGKWPLDCALPNN
jgi:hypothetical protein